MRKTASFIPFLLCVTVMLLVWLFPSLAGFCHLRISRPMTALLSSLSSRLAFPAAGIVAVALLSAVIALTLLSFGSQRVRRWLGLLLCALLLAYSLVWGALYAEPALAAKELTPQSLSLLCERLAEEADHALKRGAHEGDLACLLEYGCEAMSEQTGLRLYSAKATRFPRLFNALGLAGFYCPLTGEAIVNPEDCPDTLPFTICHELAHQAGWARENEANFHAFLACEASADPTFYYSACFTMLLYAMNELSSVDHEQWLTILSHMNRRVYERFAATNALTPSPLTGAHALQRSVTDLFLRLSGDVDGIASYERVLPLLAAHWGLS